MDTNDRLGVNIRQAKAINRAILIVLLAAAFLFGLLWAPPWAPSPAHAATRPPVYSGTVAIVYGQGVTDMYGSGKFDTARWNIPAAVKVANASGKLGKVRVVQVKTQRECYEVTNPAYCVMVGTAPTVSKATNPTEVTLVVDRYLPRKYQLLESQVLLSDKVGAKATAAQRQAWLVAALKTAIPR